jgi:molybdopterin-guanine dinucleotide biosynthesis protein
MNAYTYSKQLDIFDASFRQVLVDDELVNIVPNGIIPCKLKLKGVDILAYVGQRGSGKTTLIDNIKQTLILDHNTLIVFKKHQRRINSSKITYNFSEIESFRMRGVVPTTVCVDDYELLTSDQEYSLLSLLAERKVPLLCTMSITNNTNINLLLPGILVEGFPEAML